MLAFIRSRISREDAEDVLQDVFLRLLTASKSSDPIKNVSAWLYQTLKHRIIDHNRKHTEERMPQTVVQQDGERFSKEATDCLVNETTPDKEYACNLVWEELEAALEELPKKQRYVFEQTEFYGRSFKDLSEETGEPVATLISRKHYAVKYLRNCLLGIYDEVKESE